MPRHVEQGRNSVSVFPRHKTKIVCTIGPASRSPQILQRMIQQGMNIVRLNLAHGEPESHAEVIADVRAIAADLGKRVCILADLPGPKMRLGDLPDKRRELRRDQEVILSMKPTQPQHIPLDFEGLAQALAPGNIIYLSDGFLQLRVLEIQGEDIRCRVMVGGVLRSHNGLNVPGLSLASSSFTEHDSKLLKVMLEHDIDAVSISFVQDAKDVLEVRELAASWGKTPFLIAKIERAKAVRNIDDILHVADGIMVARGDLGVETPIEEIAITQKRLIERAALLGKPVITATQMLESMVHNRRPTRAEVTDVSNAILDGTDCIMLSEESAIGDYPVDAVRMMARIAQATEASHPNLAIRQALLRKRASDQVRVEDVIAIDVFTSVDRLKPRIIVAPTDSGATARRLARFRLPYWTVAFSTNAQTCQQLHFSYGVYPIQVPPGEHDWKEVTRQWCQQHGLEHGWVVMTHGPSKEKPRASSFVEVFQL